MQNLIITESHRMLGEEEKKIMQARCVSFTFLPRLKQVYDAEVKEVEDIFIQLSNIKALKVDNTSKYDLEKKFVREYQRNIIPLLLDLYEGGEIFLAQDNDAGGNMMASLLRYKLIDSGIPKEKIKRIIGVEITRRNGKRSLDIYGGKFYPKKLFLRIIDRYRGESEDIHKCGKIDTRLRKGHRNIVALKETLNHCYFAEDIKRESEGIGLATYLVSGVLNER